MSAEFPRAATQVCPRSVRLAPDGFLVPAGTLRVLLRGGKRLPLIYTGFALEPAVRDGQTITASGRRSAIAGDLVLADIDGWGDVVRLIRLSGDGPVEIALDAFPLRRARIDRSAILGVIEGTGRGWAGRLSAWGLSALRAPAADLRFAFRRIEEVPSFGPGAGASVAGKYRDQVGGYREIDQANLNDTHLGWLDRHVTRGGPVLVGGCGTGSEVVQIARRGYRATGIDVLPEMVAAARAQCAREGLDARFEVGDLAELDLPGRVFEGIYLSPSLYSFIAGRDRRIAMLRRLRNHLSSNGCLIFSVQHHRGARGWMMTTAAWLRRRTIAHRRIERGDWSTWFLTSRGAIGHSYVHRFERRAVGKELRDAGLRFLEQDESSYLAAA
jgi:SAM-dependent methyltransferase